MAEKKTNIPDKDYKRILFYCSSKEQIEEIRNTLPLIEGYWDAFDNITDALKALDNDDYGIVVADSTPLNPSDRDLTIKANSNSTHIKLLYSSRMTRSDVLASMWDLEESYYFRYVREEQDAMTVALYSMFTEPSHLKWFSHMQGEFHYMREKVAREKSQTVLLTGATGTGKFTLAQISHIRSSRRQNKFVFANCKKMSPERNVMSWRENEKSHFLRILRSMTETAQGGTLYFHEIDQLDIEAQEIIAYFLRKELLINTVHSLFKGIIIFSTRCNVEDNIPGHICSNELIQIIKRNVIKVPSLTEYSDEIELMAIDMLKNYCISQHIPEKVFTKPALQIIIGHVWNRNLREMFDVIKHAVSITPNKRIKADAIVMHPVVDATDTFADRLRKVKHALREAKGVKRHAAKALDITTKTLYAWMKDLGIPLDYK